MDWKTRTTAPDSAKNRMMRARNTRVIPTDIARGQSLLTLGATPGWVFSGAGWVLSGVSFRIQTFAVYRPELLRLFWENTSV